MEAVGIIKEFDALGRLVIPKDMRDRLSLDGKVELIVMEEGVLLRSPTHVLVLRSEENIRTSR